MTTLERGQAMPRQLADQPEDHLAFEEEQLLPVLRGQVSTLCP
ncbi:hypothetical protein [Kibdelosporangium phytohabitans]|nr:hypothetical protein [Kibdelosporangium phytohabitans]MBE1471713.1 hypothetical protein [Kibdelosporangium phytohabitans]